MTGSARRRPPLAVADASEQVTHLPDLGGQPFERLGDGVRLLRASLRLGPGHEGLVITPVTTAKNDRPRP